MHAAKTTTEATRPPCGHQPPLVGCGDCIAAVLGSHTARAERVQQQQRRAAIREAHKAERLQQAHYAADDAASSYREGTCGHVEKMVLACPYCGESARRYEQTVASLSKATSTKGVTAVKTSPPPAAAAKAKDEHMRFEQLIPNTEGQTYEVTADDRQRVWVNGPGGLSVGRFHSTRGYEVGSPDVEPMQLLAWANGPGLWADFARAVKAHHGLVIPDEARPPDLHAEANGIEAVD